MGKLIKIYTKNPSPKLISEATNLLKSGGLIIYPTDTVYALGCDITQSKALEKLVRLKGIKLEKAKLSFMCYDLSNLSKYVRPLDNATFRILKNYLPGSYTFILPGNNSLPAVFKKKKTVGIRIPDNSIAQSLVNTLGNPIVCTSLYDENNIIENTTDPELIHQSWHKKIDLVIDGGLGEITPSTVVDLCEPTPTVIRQGKGVFI